MTIISAPAGAARPARRRLGAGQHDAAGRRIDRHLRPQHHHRERDHQLPHIAHPAGPQAQAAAATHGYTLAFAISAALLGLGAILAILMPPSGKRLEELTSEAPAPARTVEPEPEPVPNPAAKRL